MKGPIPAKALEPGICAHCGAPFVRKLKYRQQRFCSRKCGFLAINPPDHNARVARLSAKKRGDRQRGRGAGKSYPKLYGRHAHRVVAEHKLGRPLAIGEIVHHEDQNKANYAPANLQVTNLAGHARIHFTGVKQSQEQILKRVESTRRTKAAKNAQL
jgi:hypothetical protein